MKIYLVLYLLGNVVAYAPTPNLEQCNAAAFAMTIEISLAYSQGYYFTWDGDPVAGSEITLACEEHSNRPQVKR